jgi:hypothetical protein
MWEEEKLGISDEYENNYTVKRKCIIIKGQRVKSSAQILTILTCILEVPSSSNVPFISFLSHLTVLALSSLLLEPTVLSFYNQTTETIHLLTMVSWSTPDLILTCLWSSGPSPPAGCNNPSPHWPLAPESHQVQDLPSWTARRSRAEKWPSSAGIGWLVATQLPPTRYKLSYILFAVQGKQTPLITGSVD